MLTLIDCIMFWTCRTTAYFLMCVVHIRNETSILYRTPIVWKLNPVGVYLN